VDDVLDLGDPYDGYNRTLPAAPFLPAVLAACGVPTVSHGVHSMGPKYGVTHRQVLAAAGVPVDLTPEQAAARLADARTGWAYVDQKALCPKLYALAHLRTLIVKRPAITTAEVLAGPIRGRRRTHLVTGFVHTPYPRIYALLARHAGFDTALIVRGVEGGVIPGLTQTGKVFRVLGDAEEVPVEFKPAEIGIEQSVRAPGVPGEVTDVAKLAAAAGTAALDGAPGPTRDCLVYGAALCLWHLGRHGSLKAAADAVRGVLDGGQARARLHQAI
jgi:anthranilate phosphoribosyltransferase